MKNLPLFLTSLNGTTINGFEYSYDDKSNECSLTIAHIKVVCKIELERELIVITLFEDNKQLNTMTDIFPKRIKMDNMFEVCNYFMHMLNGVTKGFHEVSMEAIISDILGPGFAAIILGKKS